MTEFDELWKWARNRGSFQQEYTELKHIFDLMKSCDCQSYLEVGCAEGNSLYILTHATIRASYIDIDEDHTRQARNDVLWALSKHVTSYHGDSRDSKTHEFSGRYDCVLIDGGHDYETVLSDSKMYGLLADKYIFWHDVQLPEVKKAIEKFMTEHNPGQYSTFINSVSYGYAICEVKK